MTRYIRNANPNPRDKEKVQAWAIELLETGFYVLDTETTGLGKQDEIVQIGIVDQHGHTIVNSLIKPTQPIPYGASAIHGIYDKDVISAPDFADLYVSLSSTLAGMPMVAYNVDFDWRMLVQSAGRFGLPPLRTGMRHCAMKQYARYKGQKNANGSYRWHKLAVAAKQERIKVENAHDALGDCRMTLALIYKMAGRL
ncbi:3'-5' exonuclease [Phototrophicus methaneseepsis]|uniref:3'-5' exonuclease n=1 Tax=Phototrophicus methaneseepsis TaxID=2710758 RepID=A0A7S8E8N5_9CHLR|nr:3'-5' exonuclease [Phototrophicus methaneseepsis]QPC82428.1 3'-5' exonuclease [Phototrophicus methaneseepsis]